MVSINWSGTAESPTFGLGMVIGRTHHSILKNYFNYVQASIRIATLLFIFHWVSSTALTAQPAAWRDSLQARIRLLQDLVQSDNYEDAQIEAGAFRQFLREKFVFCPPKAIPLISEIYFHNKDKRSALIFLGECEQDANRDRNPESKATLLQSIIKEHERWDNTERGLVILGLLKTAQDSVANRRITKQTKHLQQRIDSLEKVVLQSQEIRSNTVTLDRDRLTILGGTIGFILLSLVVFHVYSTNRWRQKLIQQEQEFDIKISGTKEHVYLPEPDLTTTTAIIEQKTSPLESSAYQSSQGAPPLYNQGERPIALIIEPNRQIALYVRSLLSSTFDVSMCSTHTEGLKMANDLLPDLIVCDTQMNGSTGIEVTRQIKLSEKTNHIPVILLSRHFGNDGRLDALRAGADAWFTRPVLDDEFGGEILKLMAQKQNKQEDFNRFLQLYYSDTPIALPQGFLKEIVTYIESRMGDTNFSADEMARKMQLTNTHFVKKLKALTGKEPVQLIREVRLEKSKYLLEKNAGTPQAISAMVGFDNPGIFSMAFKDYFGENTLLLRSGFNKSLLNG